MSNVNRAPRSTEWFAANDASPVVDPDRHAEIVARVQAIMAAPKAKKEAANGAAGKHDVVLADPPWRYHGQQDKWGAAAKFYPTMSDEELLAFNIRCLDAWGLTYRGLSFVWVKTRADGAPIGAQGVRPSIVKPTCELVLAASAVKKGRPLKLHDESIRQIIMAPKTEFSRKPDDVHEAIERMYPTASKIELFARRAYPGWACWGNEAPQAANENGAASTGGVAAQ